MYGRRLQRHRRSCLQLRRCQSLLSIALCCVVEYLNIPSHPKDQSHLPNPFPSHTLPLKPTSLAIKTPATRLHHIPNPPIPKLQHHARLQNLTDPFAPTPHLKTLSPPTEKVQSITSPHDIPTAGTNFLTTTISHRNPPLHAFMTEWLSRLYLWDRWGDGAGIGGEYAFARVRSMRGDWIVGACMYIRMWVDLRRRRGVWLTDGRERTAVIRANAFLIMLGLRRRKGAGNPLKINRLK